jgi:hypothetical protein
MERGKNINVRADEFTKGRLESIANTMNLSQADVLEKLLWAASYSIEMIKQPEYPQTQKECIKFLRMAFNITTEELSKIFNMDLFEKGF